MPLSQVQPTTIINANFERVLSLINDYINKSRLVPGCTCEKCVSMIVADALNALPTHYYVDTDMTHQAGSPRSVVQSAVAEALYNHKSRRCLTGPRSDPEYSKRDKFA